jgi:beta-1,4-mannosyl-glycoprotein beta-1,4-N-acetylglucosaminyltransferase
MVKFIDCFIFNDELDLLEFRLEEHDPFVDLFILVESKKTFSAKPKPLYATENIERYERWAHKLIIVVVDEEDIQKKHGFGLEEYSRHIGIQKIKDLLNEKKIDSNDILSVVSDVDEIYDEDEIQKLKSDGPNALTHPIRPLLRFHYYSLKVGRPGNMHWCPQKRLKIIRAGDLKEFSIQEIQHKTGPIHDKEKMGWHLSYFGGVEMVRKKLSEFSHSSMKNVRECIDNPELIRERIENSEDILGRSWEKLVVMEPEKTPRRTDLLILYHLDAIYSYSF